MFKHGLHWECWKEISEIYKDVYIHYVNLILGCFIKSRFIVYV